MTNKYDNRCDTHDLGILASACMYRLGSTHARRMRHTADATQSTLRTTQAAFSYYETYQARASAHARVRMRRLRARPVRDLDIGASIEIEYLLEFRNRQIVNMPICF